MMTLCRWCSERIWKERIDDFRDWRHAETGNAFCKRKRGQRTHMAEPAPTPSPAHVSLEIDKAATK